MAECVGTPDCCFSGTASCRGGGQSCCQEWKLLLRLRPHGVWNTAQKLWNQSATPTLSPYCKQNNCQ